MSVDVFGRPFKSDTKVLKGPPGSGFLLTESGDYDIQTKKLSNVGAAVNKNDAVNLNLLKSYIETVTQEMKNNYSTLLDEKLQDLEEQVTSEKERFVLFNRKIVWPILQEVMKIRQENEESTKKLSKIAENILDYMF